VVLGGTSGIGEAAARIFVERGARVAIAGRDSQKLAAAVVRIGGVDGHSVDATRREDLERFFAAVGPVDVLVLALSGGTGAGAFATLSLHGLRSGFDAKFFAHAEAIQAGLPYLAPEAAIVLVTAASARAALPGTAGLAAINGALEAMVRPLAAELAPRRINAVSPGVIDTPWWDAMPKESKDAFFRQAAESLPVKRVGRSQDVAEAVFLAATNPFMTGTVLEVDGGLHLPR
jgi:NAD(P)-dependent dehydrogenase (short-subunit alcohol dehydrogenase family)